MPVSFSSSVGDTLAKTNLALMCSASRTSSAYPGLWEVKETVPSVAIALTSQSASKVAPAASAAFLRASDTSPMPPMGMFHSPVSLPIT